MSRDRAAAETPRVTSMRPVADLTARRCARESALARTAGTPVLHVTAEFLDALNCRGAWAPEADEAPRPRLHAV